MQTKRAAFYDEMFNVCDGFCPMSEAERDAAGACCACFVLKELFLVFSAGLRSCSFVTRIVQNLGVSPQTSLYTLVQSQTPWHQRRHLTLRRETKKSTNQLNLKTALDADDGRKHSVTSGDLSHSVLKGLRPAAAASHSRLEKHLKLLTAVKEILRKMT